MIDKNKIEFQEILVEKFKNIFGENLEETNWEVGWERLSHLNFENKNALTGKEYKGSNQFILAVAGDSKGYIDDRWATFETAKKLTKDIEANKYLLEVLKYTNVEKQIESLQESILVTESKHDLYDIYQAISHILKNNPYEHSDLKQISDLYLTNNTEFGFCNVRKGEKATQIYLSVFQAILSEEELNAELANWDGTNPKPKKYKEITGNEYYKRMNLGLGCSKVHKKYSLFNAAQIHGIKTKEVEVTTEKNLSINELKEMTEKICKSISLDYEIKGTKAYYDPSKDSITLPQANLFKSNYNFIATCLHEVSHSTSHSTRLNRKVDALKFGDKEYAKEELVAEFATLLMTNLFFKEGYQQTKTTEKNHFEYLKSWSNILKDDPSVLNYCINQSFKVKDYIYEKCDVIRDLSLEKTKNIKIKDRGDEERA